MAGNARFRAPNVHPVKGPLRIGIDVHGPQRLPRSDQ